MCLHPLAIGLAPKNLHAMQNNCHLSKLILEQAKKYGDRAALSYRDYDLNKWVPVSWKEFALNVQKVSFALLRLGVGVQENIAVFSQNKPETHYVDFGAYGIRAVTIPFYATRCYDSGRAVCPLRESGFCVGRTDFPLSRNRKTALP